MKTISIITVYNNRSSVEEMINSAKKQKNVEIDFVLIDNTTKKFISAASALNYGTAQAIGDVLVFMHQDIEFLDDNTLEYIYDYADKNKNSVVGAAGVQDKNVVWNADIMSSMTEGVGDRRHIYDTIASPTEVFVLDECLIACHKDCMKKLKFDESMCNGWHIYGADFCLQAKDFYKMRVVAIPVRVWHKSHGNADSEYYRFQNLFAKKYKKYHKIVNTTNGYVYTNALKRNLHNLYRKIRYRKV